MTSTPSAAATSTNAVRRIGILGGVFDPVHNGHLATATLALEFFELEKVVFVPSGTPPHKSAILTPPDDRMKMLTLALESANKCEIWDGEIHRSGYSYTVDTLAELAKIYTDAKFYFIMGSDNLPEIKKWYKYEDIIKQVTLCVAERPGYNINIGELMTMVSSIDIKFFSGPMWGASSTLIREYLGAKYSCKFLMPDAVISYIKEKGLYE